MWCDGLSFRCEHCSQSGDHVCKKELLSYIRNLPDDSEELAGLYSIYKQLDELENLDDE